MNIVVTSTLPSLAVIPVPLSFVMTFANEAYQLIITSVYKFSFSFESSCIIDFMDLRQSCESFFYTLWMMTRLHRDHLIVNNL